MTSLPEAYTRENTRTHAQGIAASAIRSPFRLEARPTLTLAVRADRNAGVSANFCDMRSVPI